MRITPSWTTTKTTRSKLFFVGRGSAAPCLSSCKIPLTAGFWRVLPCQEDTDTDGRAMPAVFPGFPVPESRAFPALLPGSADLALRQYL